MKSDLPNLTREATPEISPERRLMLAIIIAAINDALGCSAVNDRDDQRDHERQRAKRWFEDGGSYFRKICCLAGLEPSDVRTAVLAYLDEQDRVLGKNRPLARNGGYGRPRAQRELKAAA